MNTFHVKSVRDGIAIIGTDHPLVEVVANYKKLTYTKSLCPH